MTSVGCLLWFPQSGGPLDAVRLADVDGDEWEALAAWARQPPRPAELPALADLLGAELPAEMGREDLLALRAECRRADWDSLAGPALGGFAGLSLFVSQAVEQEGAGARFVPEGTA
jgi:hypothetical protein